MGIRCILPRTAANTRTVLANMAGETVSGGGVDALAAVLFNPGDRRWPHAIVKR